MAQLKAFAAKLPKPVEVKEYVDNNQSYADLAAGRIDASVNSLPNLAYAAQQRSDTFAVVAPPFGEPTYFSWVGRLDDKTLIDAINAAILKVEADGRWRRSRRPGSARRWTCRRRCPSPPSDGHFDGGAELESPSFETRRSRGAPQDEDLLPGRLPPPRPEGAATQRVSKDAIQEPAPPPSASAAAR